MITCENFVLSCALTVFILLYKYIKKKKKKKKCGKKYPVGVGVEVWGLARVG